MTHAAAGFRPWVIRLRDRRHTALLVAMILLQAIHPLLVHWSERTRMLADVVFAAVAIFVFLVVFEQRWERWLALALGIPGIAGNFAYYAAAERLQTAAVILYHCSAVLFFGFAVTVILRGVFKREVIRSDDIIGAACGYLLAAIAWGSLYALVNATVPGSFHVPEEIAWQLNDWHTRHALFNYFSVVSLTGLGYGDITPTSPPIYAIISLEVVFGLFYLAVVVSQLVGLMMVRRVDKKKSS